MVSATSKLIPRRDELIRFACILLPSMHPSWPAKAPLPFDPPLDRLASVPASGPELAAFPRDRFAAVPKRQHFHWSETSAARHGTQLPRNALEPSARWHWLVLEPKCAGPPGG